MKTLLASIFLFMCIQVNAQFLPQVGNSTNQPIHFETTYCTPQIISEDATFIKVRLQQNGNAPVRIDFKVSEPCRALLFEDRFDSGTYTLVKKPRCICTPDGIPNKDPWYFPQSTHDWIYGSPGQTVNYRLALKPLWSTDLDPCQFITDYFDVAVTF